MEEFLASAERGALTGLLPEITAPDLQLVAPDGRAHGDRELLIRIMSGDVEAGVRQVVRDVAASSRFTVIESDLISPPWDPGHCPPSVLWVLGLAGDRIARIRLYHPVPAVG